MLRLNDICVDVTATSIEQRKYVQRGREDGGNGRPLLPQIIVVSRFFSGKTNAYSSLCAYAIYCLPPFPFSKCLDPPLLVGRQKVTPFFRLCSSSRDSLLIAAVVTTKPQIYGEDRE